MTMPVVYVLYEHANEHHFGLIPSFLDEDDERKAVEQLDGNYRHGGGWRPMPNFKLLGGYVLQYPGDPPLKPLGFMKLRDEMVFVYQHGIVAVVQKDRSFEVSRMD